MPRPRKLVLSTGLGLFVSFACSSTDPVAEAEKATVVVRREGLKPSPEIVVERYGSVCFFNDGVAETSFDVVFDTTFPESMPCSTTLRFEEREGVTRTTRPVRLGQCAILCFHDPGRYSFRIVGTKEEWQGTIVVRGEER